MLLYTGLHSFIATRYFSDYDFSYKTYDQYLKYDTLL